MANVFLPLLTLSGCVFPFRDLDGTIMAYMFPPFLIIRKCVFIFHEQHHDRGWHVPAIFDYQEVRVFIFHEQQSCWRIPATFDFQWVRNHIPWAAPWLWLTCSCHFWLSAGAYSHFVSWTIMAYMILTFLINRKCVFIFREQHYDRGWHVPAIFDYKKVRIYISWAAESWLRCSYYISLSAGA